MKRQRKSKIGELTPLEIQSERAVGKVKLPHSEGKVIRFYANIKRREIMDDITIEDLKLAGFVFYPFRGTKDPKSLKFTIVENKKVLVHSSVPPGELINGYEAKDYPYPVIRYELGYGYEAKLGAVRWGLRTPKELQAFMSNFNYSIPDGTDQ